MAKIITITTDFGTQDAYVGAMKGVILGICPGATLVDLTHEILPHDVVGGAFVLAEAAPWFPIGTVHLAVVDPGVGSSRRPIAVRTARGFYVGPDNGLFTWCLRDDPPVEAAELLNPKMRLPKVSSVFHGRDVFAPAAAHLARGVLLRNLGPAPSKLVTVSLPGAKVVDGGAVGEVIHVDGFGNLVTSHPASDLPDRPRVEIGDVVLSPVFRSYADVAEGALLALIGSSGFLEIALRNGSAARHLGLGRGAPVRVVGAESGGVDRVDPML